MHHIGHKLRTWRKQQGWSQDEMAEFLDYPRSTYSRYERNETSINFDVAQSFAVKMGLTLAQLIADETAVIIVPVLNRDVEMATIDELKHTVYALQDSHLLLNRVVAELSEKVIYLEKQAARPENVLNE